MIKTCNEQHHHQIAFSDIYISHLAQFMDIFHDNWYPLEYLHKQEGILTITAIICNLFQVLVSESMILVLNNQHASSMPVGLLSLAPTGNIKVTSNEIKITFYLYDRLLVLEQLSIDVQKLQFELNILIQVFVQNPILKVIRKYALGTKFSNSLFLINGRVLVLLFVPIGKKVLDSADNSEWRFGQKF